MLKVIDTQIGMIEIPNEISLILAISNCPYQCKYCHTPELQMDVGVPIRNVLFQEIENNIGGITCVCFLGGDADLLEAEYYAGRIKEIYDLKTAIYLGSEDYPISFLNVFDFIKIGKYIHELGGLSSPNTNQKLFHIEQGQPTNITNKFWIEFNE